MIEEQASRTALRVAMRRAVHQILDYPLVFEDPVALPILPPETQRRLHEEAATWQTPSDRALRAFMVARGRYAEDQLAAAVRRGVAQYVVLGAGLDTFAYRNRFPQVRVFEVDHPATQAWKRKRLIVGNIGIPDQVTFVPVDFEKESLETKLVEAGFDRAAPGFFSWLGVTQYLTREAAFGTLRFIASLVGGSGVVFDYSVPRELLEPVEQLALDALAERVARAGEPFRLFFNPAELETLLREIGFRDTADLGAAEINRRYFDQRPDGIRVLANMARLMCAST